MAGITIDVHVTGLAELMQDYANAPADVRQRMEDVLAEKAIEYNGDLRGTGPGVGLTPFDTGRLLLSGNIDQSGIDLVFTNDARDPKTGAEYAEWARKAGRPIGDYEHTSGVAFDQRFGRELAVEWDDALSEAFD